MEVLRIAEKIAGIYKERKAVKVTMGLRDNVVYYTVPIKDVLTLDEYTCVEDMLYGCGTISAVIDEENKVVIVKGVSIALPYSMRNISGVELLAGYSYIKALYRCRGIG